MFSHIPRLAVKALPWFTIVREKLTDPDYAPWFVRFGPPTVGDGWHVPSCDSNYNPPLCSDFYHDQEQTPGYPHGDGDCSPPACDVGSVPVGEYLFNFVNANVSVHGETFIHWYIEEYFFGPSGGGNPNITGFELDDFWDENGPSEMESHAVEDLGMSAADIKAMVDAFNWAKGLAYDAIFTRGKFDWTSFYTTNPTWPACSGPFVGRDSCASDLRALCKADAPVQTKAMLYGWSPGACDWNPGGYNPGNLTIPVTDIANFQLIRGPYAYIGSGWQGCSLQYERPPLIDGDFGTPLGICSETAPSSGVFTRQFTKSTVSIDCGTFEPTITFK